jgi:hypothetical protein
MMTKPLGGCGLLLCEPRSLIRPGHVPAYRREHLGAKSGDRDMNLSIFRETGSGTNQYRSLVEEARLPSELRGELPGILAPA